MKGHHGNRRHINVDAIIDFCLEFLLRVLERAELVLLAILLVLFPVLGIGLVFLIGSFVYRIVFG